MLIYAFPNLTMVQIGAMIGAFDDDVGAASRWLERCRPCHQGRGLYFTKGHYKELQSGEAHLNISKKRRRFKGNNKKVLIKPTSKVFFWFGNIVTEPKKFLYDLFDSVSVDGVEVGIRNFVNQPVVLTPGKLTQVKLVAKRKNKQVAGSRIMEIKGPGLLDDLFDFTSELDKWMPQQ